MVRRRNSRIFNATWVSATFAPVLMFALWLHEVNASVIHLIHWHYLPMLVFGLIGLWLDRGC